MGPPAHEYQRTAYTPRPGRHITQTSYLCGSLGLPAVVRYTLLRYARPEKRTKMLANTAVAPT